MFSSSALTQVDASAPPVRSPRIPAAVADAAIFAGWCVVVLVLASRHVMWRDEVRALSLAIDPPDLSAMIDGIRGEGHPALWYLLLRAGYGLSGSVLVLPVLAFAAAAAGIGLFLARAPFGSLLKLGVAVSAFGLFEYPVVARNYGISLLPIFAFALLYDKHRKRGILLGLVLFGLANTNVHSVVAVGAFLLLWGAETIAENGVGPSRPMRVFLLNAAIAGCGALLAALVVRGPHNGAVSAAMSLDPTTILRALVDPGTQLNALAPTLPGPLLSCVLFGCCLGLLGRPAAFGAALFMLLGLSGLFAVVYPGQYRHAALFVVVLLALKWIADAREPVTVISRPPAWAARVGIWSLVVLLALQVGLTYGAVAAQLRLPWSNSRAAAALIAADPRLAGAIIMAEPDFMAEPLPYYGVDCIYLPREARFGHVVDFSLRARRDQSLGDVLATAERLKRDTGREVVILMAYGLDLRAPPRSVEQVWGWVFRADPADTAAFLAATERLGHLEPSIQGEDYTLYRLR